MISETSKLIESASSELAVSRIDIEVLSFNVEQLLAAVITQHAHQGIVHFQQTTVGCREVSTFLNVVEQFAIEPLRTTIRGDVFQYVDDLLRFFGDSAQP